ncbi:MULTISPECIES: Fe-S cluster assembly protein SufD [Arthrobacter]|uniref:Fe-S cluster assembly protein SufD n=1 Tax=Arthrobacter psychrochitiniphilus TaxID=291045 RepID=A0A2V3DQT1_9MICC|nr:MULTISPECIES: Fe-S cluster assembly protein SufD [Arthrobacter]NYG17542.1 Fe-S cluster assembly protein SufD [Arthrobacter psychrochitiniphilus]PXA64646.1 Fe-S cluster assembly protein SufD [Arthrobacter psychrochitiniphilus]
MTELTEEKTTGEVWTQGFIKGMTEEGESLSEINPESGPLGGAAAKAHSHGGDSHGGGVGVPDSSRAGRLTSYKLADFPVITGREEEWRFTPLKRMRGLDRVGVKGQELNGPAPLVEVNKPDGVTVETVGREDSRIGSAGIPEDRVAAAAWENFAEATVVTLPAEFVGNSENVTTLTLTGQGEIPAASHIVVHAKKFATGVVVLDHRGTAVLSENVEILVEDGANLTVVSIQDWNDDAVHASAQHIKVGRDAKVKHVVINLGGNLLRTTPAARYSGTGAEVEMYGLYFADAGQHLEQRLFVDHSTKNCKSRVTYKGALQGENAHAVWIGDVLIRKQAEGTDTYEMNRNLILTKGARADSVPNLEIETGMIEGAGHASATGRFDDEQLFYLQARGIDEESARRLVVRGFLNEVIQQIKVPALEERLRETVERELEATAL